ncbi:putative AAA ATPase [Skeletonema marinoi]|uniref:AAA ATPase n=1 Tax=Skeletonema marinoi TaxID=267567 RepID=A0AAD8YEJ5_9STRA|nr:putative AAA ATPase [Skeletonema marinoi]
MMESAEDAALNEALSMLDSLTPDDGFAIDSDDDDDDMNFNLTMRAAGNNDHNKLESMIILSEWISRTIDQVDRTSSSLSGATALGPELRKSMILCSDDYLLSALRVSCSLADSICRAEEEGGKLLPIPSLNWAACINVHVQGTREINGTLTIENGNGEQENHDKAEFLPFLCNVNDEAANHRSTMQRIYSLGIVLYEIFSGGERPTNLLKKEQTADVGSNELSAIEEDFNFDPLPFDQASPIDIGVDIDELLEKITTEEEQNLPKKRQSLQSKSISIEPLKAKWIPGPLCDLIVNMLDSTNGTLAGEDSYKSMADVRADLQLMMEKPKIFLFDQDMGKLSVTGLQFRDTMFGRNAELSTIKEANRRSISGDGELVIISGPSGSGKSLLASEFGRYVSAGGGIVLSGKFDQLKQGKPFSALASAFDIYCGNLMKESCPSSTVKVLASNVMASLGGEAYHLAKMIPNLALILGPDVFDISHDQVCDHPQERLEYLLCQFVEVISSSSGAPVTLFLDDLQWADSASIAAVNQLLFTADFSSSPSSSSLKGRKQFFFYGCCREGAIDKKHLVWKVFLRAQLLGVKHTNVKLGYFEEETLNTMVSETLRLSPRLTRSLSDVIYHKTKGNPLFVSQLMLSLSKEGLLRPSLSRRRWEWDKEKIQICNMRLSCFGAAAEFTVIKTLEGALNKNLVDNLDVAVREGLLDKADDMYRFTPPADVDTDDSLLLIAANQLNLAGPEAVQDKSQNAIVADLNLRAGKKAMEMSDFVEAYSYFDNGISLQLLYEQVLTYGRTFEDKLNVMYFSTCALAFSSRLPESIEKGLDILSKLGFELRGDESSMEACVQETKSFLSGYTDNDILNTRRMTDPTTIIAMKFLGKMELGMTQIMPKSIARVTQRIIQLSLLHGMSPVSPIGFVHLGSFIAKFGDISGGYHYVKLARSLLDKVGSRESAGEVICIGTQVVSYVEPLQAALEYHDEGFTAAMAYGDVIQAALNHIQLCISYVFAGYIQHSVFKLIGTDEEPKYVAEGQNVLATNNSVKTTYYYQKAFISFTFRSYDGTKENIGKYLACIGNTWANLFINHSFHAFYIGLISFWLARKSKDGQHWIERGKSSKLALKKWAESSSWTFENKWFLLEAEESFCNNNYDAAKTYYDKAISSAKDHKFINEEALACELAAYFHLELGQKDKALELFLLAHEKYHEWGAFGKCTSLYEFVVSNFSSPIGTGLTDTDNMRQEIAFPNLEVGLLSSLDDALRRHTDMASDPVG